MTLHFLELACLLILVLLISAGVVLWMKSQKKINPMAQLVLMVVMLLIGFVGMKWAGETFGIIAPANPDDPATNPYRQALILLDEPYPSYTSANNLASTNRESLTTRFQRMEKLELGEINTKVRHLSAMIGAAPATGQTGIYNMRMTSDIQARWEELRRELQKQVGRSSRSG